MKQRSAKLDENFELDFDIMDFNKSQNYKYIYT